MRHPTRYTIGQVDAVLGLPERTSRHIADSGALGLVERATRKNIRCVSRDGLLAYLAKLDPNHRLKALNRLTALDRQIDAGLQGKPWQRGGEA